MSNKNKDMGTGKLVDGYYYYNVMLNINTVKELSSKLYLLPDVDIDAIQGKYIIDAKSVMGLFSFDLTKPIILKVHKDDITEEQLDEFENIIRPCIV